MPWDNNTGGGSGGGRNGGPWGQAPGGGGSGGGPRRPGGTPNLEEILKTGRDRFQGGLPSGIPGGRWGIVGAVLALGVFWASNAIYTVAPQEQGVELFLGKPKAEVSGPGLHFHFWPIETVEKVVMTVNQTNIGSIVQQGSRGQVIGANSDGLMLSGDQNIVNVRFAVVWQIDNPSNYLFNVRAPDELVRSAAESAMREVVGRRPAQDIFRDDRTGIALEVKTITQAILDGPGASEDPMAIDDAGVQILEIAIENVAPPAEVANAFDEVQRAEQDEDRLQEEARSYANTLLGNARGEAARMREDAAAYKNRVVQEAQGEAARFTSVYEEYAKAPEVTRRRLYLETMEQVLGGANKVLIEGGAGANGVVPYLPLPELRANSTSGQR